jgi:hypothetical protein
VTYPGNAGRLSSTTPSTPEAPDAAAAVISTDTASSYASSILSVTTTTSISSALSTPTLFSHFPSPPSSLPRPLPFGPTSPPRVSASHLRAYPHPRRFVLSAPSRSSYLDLGSNDVNTTTVPSSRAVLFETPTSSTRVLHVRRPACSMAGGTSDSARAVASTATVLQPKKSGSCRAVTEDEPEAHVAIQVEMYDEDDDEGEDDMDPDAEADSIYYSARSSFSL